MDLRAHRTQAHAVASRLQDTSIRYDVFSDTCFIFNKNIFTHPTISPHLTLGLFYIQIIQTRISLEYKPFLHSSHIDLYTHLPFFSPSITNRNFHHPFFCSIDISYTFQHTTSIESPTFHKTTSHFSHTYHPLSYTTTHHHTHPHKHTNTFHSSWDISVSIAFLDALHYNISRHFYPMVGDLSCIPSGIW